MAWLLNSLVQIALLRRDPGVLPASTVLVALLAVAYAGAGALHAWAIDDDRILARVSLDVAFALGFFGLLLAVTRRGHRYRQTMSAVFGAYVLLTPIVLVMLLAREVAGRSYAAWLFTNVGSTLVVIWFLLIVAHIVRCALDTGLVTGYAVAIAWVLASWAVAGRVFPVAG